MNLLGNPFDEVLRPELYRMYNAVDLRTNPFNAAESPGPHAKWGAMDALGADCRTRTAAFIAKQWQLNGAACVGTPARLSLQQQPTVLGALWKTARTVVRLDPEADSQIRNVRTHVNEARRLLDGDVSALAVAEQTHADGLGYMEGVLDSAHIDYTRLAGARPYLDDASSPKVALIRKYIDTNEAMHANKRVYMEFMKEDSRVLTASLKSGNLSLSEAERYLNLYTDLFRKGNPAPAPLPLGIADFQHAVAEERLSAVPSYFKESAKMVGGLLAGAAVVSSIGLGALFSTGYFSR